MGAVAAHCALRTHLQLDHLQTVKKYTEQSSMSHMCGRASSARDKASNVFYKKIRPAYNDALSTSRVITDHRCVKCSKSDNLHKTKRLRSRKERNQIRGGGKESSIAKSCHYHYSHQSRKDASHVHQCYNTLDTDKCPNKVPEPIVITNSRLIGHHGLFNHEVRSIDIERLLSEQRKRDRNRQLEKMSTASLHRSAFASPSPNKSKHLSDSTNDEAGTSKEKDQPSTKTFNDYQEQKNKILRSDSPLLDITPGQRPKKSSNPSTEINNDSSKHSSSDVVINETKEAQSSLCEDNRESHPTLNASRENVNYLQVQGPFIIEHTPKNSASATNQKQVSHPSPLPPPSSPTAVASNCTDVQQEHLRADSVAGSVKAVAANLCNSVSFSLLRKRNLVSESREVLMKALRQRHGEHLQANILEVQRRLRSYGHVQKEVPELCQSPVFFEKGELFITDEVTAQFKAASFDTTSHKQTGRLQFNWDSIDWTSPYEETAACWGTPAENTLGLDSTFGCNCSPQICMDFDFQKTFSTEKEVLFPLTPTSSWVDGPKRQFEDIFITTKRKELPMFESPTHFFNLPNTRTGGYSRSPLTSVANTHYSYTPHLSESAPNSFGTNSFGKAFSDDIPHFQQGSSFEPFSHFNIPPASPALRPHHVDVSHYPPSYMLERCPTLPAGSFLSPEHWSFPPMRLY